MKHLTFHEVETLVFRRETLTNSTISSMLSHIQICEVCRNIAEMEQLLYAEFRKNTQAEVRPPYRMILKHKNFSKKRMPGKIRLAADTAVVSSAGFSNVGTYISTEYGLLIRFSLDNNNGRLSVTALTAHEDVDLSYLLLRLEGQETFIQLNKDAKGVIPAELVSTSNRSFMSDIEIIFPMIKFDLRPAEMEYSNGDLSVQVVVEDSRTTFIWKKMFAYLPDVKRAYLIDEGGLAINRLVDSSSFTSTSGPKIQRVALYPA